MRPGPLTPLFVLAVTLGTGIPATVAQVPGVDPFAAQQQREEAIRVNRQYFQSHRQRCAKLRADRQLEPALNCYRLAVERAVDPMVDLPSVVPLDEGAIKEIENELKTIAAEENKKAAAKTKAADLLTQANESLGRREFASAKLKIDEARTLDPTNAAIQPMARLIEQKLREAWVRKAVTYGILGTFTVGAMVGAFVWLRKAKRVSTLEMIEGPQPGDIFRLEKETTVVGALDKEADWPITDLSRRISRRHCEITRSKGRYFLIDVSTNGTSINGRPAPTGEPVLLRRGDLIALTDDVVLRFY